MNEAFTQAFKAVAADEVPVGAIVVSSNGTIIGRGYNQVESKKNQLAHAECIAIQNGTKNIDDWRLDGCILYVTLEPCRMCMGLIELSRISKLIYGANSPLFGFQLDNEQSSWVYKNDVVIRGGVGAEKSQLILKQFFQKKRNKKGEYQEAGLRGNQGCADAKAK